MFRDEHKVRDIQYPLHFLFIFFFMIEALFPYICDDKPFEGSLMHANFV
jgi:hypothetical protein